MTEEASASEASASEGETSTSQAVSAEETFEADNTDESDEASAEGEEESEASAEEGEEASGEDGEAVELDADGNPIRKVGEGEELGEGELLLDADGNPIEGEALTDGEPSSEGSILEGEEGGADLVGAEGIKVKAEIN